MPISHQHNFYKYPDYISPLPADDLIKVGGIKQDMYSKGVEALNQQSETLSKYGLDLVREVDKQYFNQQVNKLNEALSKSTKGVDFGNLSQVRSIMNVGQTLENDKNLLSSLQSTQEFRRRQSELSKLKPGERSAANDWDYMKDAERWYNGEFDQKLTSRQYTPYRELSPKILKLAKELEPDIRSSIVRNNGFLTETQIKELTQKRLMEAIDANLDESDKNQIRIDTEFHIKDIPGGEINKYYFDKGNTILSDIDRQLSVAQNLMTGGHVFSDEEKEHLQDLSERKQLLLNNLDAVQQGNEEIGRQAFFVDHYRDFITGQAKAYRYQQTQKKMTADPFALENVKASHAMQRLSAQLAAQKEENKLNRENSYNIAKLKAEDNDSPKTNKALEKDINDTDKEFLKSSGNLDANSDEFMKLPPSVQDKIALAMRKLGVKEDDVTVHRTVDNNGNVSYDLYDGTKILQKNVDLFGSTAEDTEEPLSLEDQGLERNDTPSEMRLGFTPAELDDLTAVGVDVTKMNKEDIPQYKQMLKKLGDLK